MNERKIKLIMKGGKFKNQFTPLLEKRSGIIPIDTEKMRNQAPKNLSDWKKEILNYQILNGTMSIKACMYLQ